MKRRIRLVVSVLFIGVVVHYLNRCLAGRPAHTMVIALPGAAILGFYAAMATNFLAMALWHSRQRSISSLLSRHSLLFFVIAGFCMDYVLNDYTEITSPKDGSYGLVVFIDFIIWGFLWFTSNLYFPRKGNDYSESLVALLAPVFPVFREMAHSKHPFHFGAATIDLIVGIVFMVAWIVLPTDPNEQTKYQHITTAAKYLILVGILYGLLMVSTNVLSHFFGLDLEISLAKIRQGGFWGNALHLLVATVLAFVLFYRNPNGLRERFAGPCM